MKHLYHHILTQRALAPEKHLTPRQRQGPIEGGPWSDGADAPETARLDGRRVRPRGGQLKVVFALAILPGSWVVPTWCLPSRETPPQTRARGTAFAAPAQPPATVAASRHQAPSGAAAGALELRFRDALARGRSLATQGDLLAAAAALREALSVRPEDPVVLSELGLVAYRQRDLTLAEEATRRSLTLAVGQRRDCLSPRPAGRCLAFAGEVRASSLYNLGLILEARSDKRGALDAYARSLNERCSREVRERLLKLDGDPPAACDPVVTRLMAGPFARLSDWCEQEKKRVFEPPQPEDDGPIHWDRFSCTPDTPIRALAPLPAQAQAVQVFASEEHGTRGSAEASHVRYHLGLRLARGWFLCPDVGMAEGWNAHSSHGIATEAKLSLESLELGALVAGTRIIRLVTKVIEDTDDLVDYSKDLRAHKHHERMALAIAGVGLSGQPRCTQQISFRFQAWEVDGWEEGARIIPGTRSNSELKVQIDPDGQVVIVSPAHPPGQRWFEPALLGKHRLRFP